MSCGNHHDLDCREVLARIYDYLDNELDLHDHDAIAGHLDECGPCLRTFGLEQMVKSLVARTCCDQAPAQLRARVLAEIVSVRITIGG